jgi:hypothetical protein
MANQRDGKFKIVLLKHGYASVEDERRIVTAAGGEFDFGAIFSRFDTLVIGRKTFEAMLKTAANARDTWYMDQDKLARTVRMDSLGIQATDFQITKTQSEALFNAGVVAAQQFLAGKGQGGLAATQGYTPAPVAVRPASVSPATPRLATMHAPTLTADPHSNPLVWNTLAIVLVSLAIIAVLGLLIAVMSGALDLM